MLGQARLGAVSGIGLASPDIPGRNKAGRTRPSAGAGVRFGVLGDQVGRALTGVVPSFLAERSIFQKGAGRTRGSGVLAAPILMGIEALFGGPGR